MTRVSCVTNPTVNVPSSAGLSGGEGGEKVGEGENGLY